jgi:predicted metal-binding protein
MFVEWKLVSVHLEIVLVLAQDQCTICANVPQAWKSFQAHLMVLLGDVGQAEAHFDSYEDSFNPVQDSCMVCNECTTGMEITLGTPDSTPR